MKKKYTFWDKLSLKCVLIGDTGVGKSSLASRLSSRTFKTDYTPTLFDNFSATISVDGTPYHLSLFDTAGKEDFNKLRVLSYINSDVFLICFTIANSESLHNVIESWVPELRHYVPNTPFILVGTQVDVRCQKPDAQIVKQTTVSVKEAKEVAMKTGAMSYVEVSSLSGEGIEDLTSEIIMAAKRDWENKCTKKRKCCAPCKLV